MNPSAANDWLQERLQNLAREGFVISEDVSHSNSAVKAVARRTRFELTKFGFSETFFIFGEFESLTAHDLREFSSRAFNLANRSKTIPLPCGLFESVWCFAVAMTDHVDSAAADSVQSDTPPRHWAAAEIPVVFDRADRRLYYFEKTPLWGGAYYSGFRSQIKKFLDS